MNNKPTITIAETFGPTIQGEGPLIGMPTVFVRTGGCDFRCSWCDSMHAVDTKVNGHLWDELTTQEVFDRILDHSAGYPTLVSLSGGNPAQQPLGELIDQCHDGEYTVAMETQGTIAQPWFSKLDWLILSPKGPSSRMPFNQARLDACVCASGPKTKVALKFVIFDDDDYEFARSLIKPPFSDWRIPVYLSVGTDALPANAFCGDEASRQLSMNAALLKRMRWLIDKVGLDHWNEVIILPQLHVLLWGDKKGV